MAVRGPKLSRIQDVSAFLARVIRETYRGDLDSALAGKLGYLLNVLKGCLETGDLEKRLEQLEDQVSATTHSTETRK